MNIFNNTLSTHFYRLTEQSLEAGINPLLDYLFDRPKWYQFKERYILRRYKKFLLKEYTPSYAFLCGIYDFICTCENVYMWPNTETSKMYAYRKLKPGIRSFKFTVNNPNTVFGTDAPYIIEYTLYTNNQINISIKREWGDNVKTDFSFEGGQNMNLSVENQILFNTIIDETMKRVVDIFEYIYWRTSHVELKGNYARESRRR